MRFATRVVFVGIESTESILGMSVAVHVDSNHIRGTRIPITFHHGRLPFVLLASLITTDCELAPHYYRRGLNTGLTLASLEISIAFPATAPVSDRIKHAQVPTQEARAKSFQISAAIITLPRGSRNNTLQRRYRDHHDKVGKRLERITSITHHGARNSRGKFHGGS